MAKRYEVQHKYGFERWETIEKFEYSEDGFMRAVELESELSDVGRYAEYRVRVEGYGEDN